MIWLPASIFVICCIAQLWFYQRVASALEARHPDTYRAIYGPFAWSRLGRFALLRRDRGLDDPELTARTRQLQLLVIAAMASWVGLAVMILTGLG
jgi:hypothetical protein